MTILSCSKESDAYQKKLLKSINSYKQLMLSQEYESAANYFHSAQFNHEDKEQFIIRKEIRAENETIFAKIKLIDVGITKPGGFLLDEDTIYTTFNLVYEREFDYANSEIRLHKEYAEDVYLKIYLRSLASEFGEENILWDKDKMKIKTREVNPCLALSYDKGKTWYYVTNTLALKDVILSNNTLFNQISQNLINLQEQDLFERIAPSN